MWTLSKTPALEEYAGRGNFLFRFGLFSLQVTVFGHVCHAGALYLVDDIGIS